VEKNNHPMKTTKEISRLSFSTTPEDRSFLQNLESAEMAYWCDLYNPLIQMKATPGVVQTGPAILFRIPEVNVLAFNRVLGLGLTAPANIRQIDDIIDWYKEANVPRFFVQVSPHAQPAWLPQMLEERGFHYYNNWVKLARPLSGAVPEIKTSLEIVPAEPSQAGLFGKMITEAFGWPDVLNEAFAGEIGRPGWRHYFALHDAQPVATAAMFIHEDLACLAIAATMPGFRGMGAQSALIARRIADATELGCRHIMVETAEDMTDRPVASYRNMIRFGFQRAYNRANYLYQF
jgi:GNAT superfamily N-acetyltransferase